MISKLGLNITNGRFKFNYEMNKKFEIQLYHMFND